jgi:hypothetical protein
MRRWWRLLWHLHYRTETWLQINEGRPDRVTWDPLTRSTRGWRRVR